MATPAFEKKNPFTDIIAETRAFNRGSPIGRQNVNVGPTFMTSEAPASVTTPAMRGIPPVESDLPPDEVARRNALLSGEPDVGGVGRITPTISFPKKVLPDFTRIQSIDLQREVITIDGFEVPIPSEDINEIKKWCVIVVSEHITLGVNKAFAAINQTGEGAAQGQTETPRQESDGETQPVVPTSEGLESNTERPEE